ncbi:MAG: biotin/lipoyl-binding protein [Pirellulales bacterium]|nr:biotin/lipoyl-binding protein [Pirellulales bacterium]
MQILMPQLNDAGDPGTINELFIAAGDVLAVGDRLMAVEMDKAIVEIEATEAGRVNRVCVKVGDEVEVGQVLVELE